MQRENWGHGIGAVAPHHFSYGHSPQGNRRNLRLLLMPTELRKGKFSIFFPFTQRHLVKPWQKEHERLGSSLWRPSSSSLYRVPIKKVAPVWIWKSEAQWRRWIYCLQLDKVLDRAMNTDALITIRAFPFCRHDKALFGKWWTQHFSAGAHVYVQYESASMFRIAIASLFPFESSIQDHSSSRLPLGGLVIMPIRSTILLVSVHFFWP